MHNLAHFSLLAVLGGALLVGCAGADSPDVDAGPGSPDLGSVAGDDGPPGTDDGPLVDAGPEGPSDTFYRVCDIADPACAAGEECTIFGFGDGVCVPTCETLGSTEECVAGFSCQMFLSPDSDFRCQPTTACSDGCDDASECVEIGCLGQFCVPASYDIPNRTCG